MQKRKYYEYLEKDWENRAHSREEYELDPPPDLKYDAVDQLDDNLRSIDFSKVRLEYLQYISKRANIHVVKNDDILSFNESLGNLWTTFFDTDNEIVPHMLAFLNPVLLYADEDTRASNLVEQSANALSLFENFCEVLKANGYHAFYATDINKFKRALENKNANLPEVASPFYSILTALNKLFIFKAFYFDDFGDEDEVQSNEAELQTTIDKTAMDYRDVIRLLAQMYYLQPQEIVEDEEMFTIRW
jgi:hypothetical protein